MNVVSWLVVFVLGYSLLSTFSFREKIIFKFGLSFPTGMGINAFLLFVFEIFHIKYNNSSIILCSDIVLILINLGIIFLGRKPNFKLNFKPKKLIKKFMPINLSWIFLMSVIIYVVFSIVNKTLFWPVTTYDSINGYDFLAKAIANEGTFNNTIFNPDYHLFSVRSFYPPLVPFNFSIAYIFGSLNSKIVVTFFYVSIIIAFYYLLKVYTTHTLAALTTLFLIITPEYAAFSALSSPNPPCTFYSAIGVLSVYTWYLKNEKPFFYFGLLLIAFALWTRTETIIFAVASGFIILLKTIEKKKFIYLIVFGISCLIVLLAWQLYLYFVIPFENEQPIITHLYWDIEKLQRMLGKVKKVTFSLQYYGIVVYMFLGLILLNIKNIIVHKDKLVLLLSIFIPWVLYLFVYYQINTDYMPGGVGWIEAGYKRGFFYFLPLMLYYCSTNKLVLYITRNYFSLIKYSKN